MKILVINAGSSSLKYQLIETDTEAVIAKGVCERIGLDGSRLTHTGKQRVTIDAAMPTHTEAIKLVLDALVSSEHGVISSMSEIAAASFIRARTLPIPRLSRPNRSNSSRRIAISRRCTIRPM